VSQSPGRFGTLLVPFRHEFNPARRNCLTHDAA
jgi:hypothetical protein